MDKSTQQETAELFDDGIDPSDDGMQGSEDQTQTQTQDPPTTESTQTSEGQQQPSPPAVDPNAIQNAITQGFQSLQQQQTPTTPKEPTQEELNELLQVFRAQPELVEQLFGETASPESRLNAINNIVAGAVNEAVRTSTYHLQKPLNELHGQIQPLTAHQQQSQVDSQINEVVAAYPALKDMRGEILVSAQELIREGFKNPNKSEVIKAIAARVEQRGKAFNPNFTLTPNSNQKSSQTMAGGTPGGQGGVGGGQRQQSSTSAKPAHVSIFE